MKIPSKLLPNCLDPFLISELTTEKKSYIRKYLIDLIDEK